MTGPDAGGDGAPTASGGTGLVRFGLAVVVAGAAAAGFAVVFRASLAGWLRLTTGYGNVVVAVSSLPAWVRLLLPAVGGLGAGGVALLLARHRSARGVGEVMEAVVIGRSRLSMRVTLLKSAASWMAISTGGSLGREGPLIRFGGAVGQLAGERFGLDRQRVRVLIAAGTAAGFAAAYNTPFAAVLFVLEIVTSVIVVDMVVPVLVATVIATVATRAVVGEGPIYGTRAFAVHHPAELIGFAVLGAAAAVAAQGFMRLLAQGEHWFRRPFFRQPWRPALGGLIAGGIVAALPEVAGNGYEPLNGILDGQFAIGFLAWLMVAKAVATTASVSSGSPGGVFTPTLLIGGSVGFLFGTAMGQLFGDAVGDPGGYALVGMAATTAASTHAPLMAAVMAFELSGDYAVVLPLILATATAALLSKALRRDSIYTAELTARGIGWEVTLDGRRMVDPDDDDDDPAAEVSSPGSDRG